MPRKLLVGAIAAGALAVTAGTAFALTGGADDTTTRGATGTTTSLTAPSSDDDPTSGTPTSSTPTSDSPAQSPAGDTLTADEASTIVRNEYGGTVTEVERETEHGRQEWKVEINAADGKSYDVRVDAKSGNVTRADQDDDNDDNDDND